MAASEKNQLDKNLAAVCAAMDKDFGFPPRFANGGIVFTKPAAIGKSELSFIAPPRPRLAPGFFRRWFERLFRRPTIIVNVTLLRDRTICRTYRVYRNGFEEFVGEKTTYAHEIKFPKGWK